MVRECQQIRSYQKGELWTDNDCKKNVASWREFWEMNDLIVVLQSPTSVRHTASKPVQKPVGNILLFISMCAIMWDISNKYDVTELTLLSSSSDMLHVHWWISPSTYSSQRNVVVKLLPLLLRIQEVPISNLSPETSYRDSDIRAFP